MQVGKWGNSLAVRLPTAVVEALALKEGDQVEIEIAGPRSFRVSRNDEGEQALARLRAFQRSLPPGWRFSREETHERGGGE